MPNSSKAEPIFAGEFRHALDAKKRITIPSRWRGGSDEFFLQPHPEHECLIAMTPAAFQKIREKAETSLAPERQADFLRIFASQTLHCTVDKQGRLLLSDEQCRQAGLKGETVLVGMMGRFEIWSPKAWNTYRAKRGINLKEVVGAIGL